MMKQHYDRQRFFKNDLSEICLIDITVCLSNIFLTE